MLKRIKNLFNRKTEEAEPSLEDKIRTMFEDLQAGIISIQVGEDFDNYGSVLCEICQKVREEIKDECGFIIPEVNIRTNDVLQENEMVIYIRGEKKSNDFFVPNEKGIKEEFYDILKTVVYDSIDMIFTNEIAEKYIEQVQRKNGWLIWNLTNVLSIIDIKTIMLDIIQKGKSLNNIDYIFEQIGEQVLTEGKYRDCSIKHNPHIIAKQIAKYL